jgi:hypothetical protein
MAQTAPVKGQNGQRFQCRNGNDRLLLRHGHRAHRTDADAHAGKGTGTVTQANAST